jgi:hypothetical protein
MTGGYDVRAAAALPVRQPPSRIPQQTAGASPTSADSGSLSLQRAFPRTTSPPAVPGVVGLSSGEVEDDAAAQAAGLEEMVRLGGLIGREDPGHPEGQGAVFDLLA